MKIRIATRSSELALTQTRWVAARLRELEPGLEVEEIHVTTRGDKELSRPLAAIGGKGLFVSEVEAFVASGEADLAVHSLKDVPGDQDLPEGLELVAFPPREDPHDVLVTKDGLDLDDLAAGSSVGTTSLRRVAQLSVRRPDLRYVNLRGNVGTRLRKLDDGELDAVVLAAAGLSRLSLLETRKHVRLPIEISIPAVGQGVLALETRTTGAVRDLVARLDDPRTRIVVEAERALLRELQGSCRTPVGGHAELALDGSTLRLTAIVASVDGYHVLTSSEERFLRGDAASFLEEARAMGRELAKRLHDQGARKLMLDAETEIMRREADAPRVAGRGPKWPN